MGRRVPRRRIRRGDREDIDEETSRRVPDTGSELKWGGGGGKGGERGGVLGSRRSLAWPLPTRTSTTSSCSPRPHLLSRVGADCAAEGWPRIASVNANSPGGVDDGLAINTPINRPLPGTMPRRRVRPSHWLHLLRPRTGRVARRQLWCVAASWLSPLTRHGRQGSPVAATLLIGGMHPHQCRWSTEPAAGHAGQQGSSRMRRWI